MSAFLVLLVAVAETGVVPFSTLDDLGADNGVEDLGLSLLAATSSLFAG
jgi:hypothetical protein